jgi:hypothetical protein
LIADGFAAWMRGKSAILPCDCDKRARLAGAESVKRLALSIPNS